MEQITDKQVVNKTHEYNIYENKTELDSYSHQWL